MLNDPDQKKCIAQATNSSPANIRLSPLPWTPIPDELLAGSTVTIFREMPDLTYSVVESNVLVRLDICGFFLYWYSLLNEVRLIDLVHLDDVEIVVPTEWPYTGHQTEWTKWTAESSSSRWRPDSACLRLQIPRSCAKQFCGESTVDYYQYVNVIMQFERSNAIVELWQETLINIAFRHRHVIEKLAILDVLKKQWTHLILQYGSISIDPNGSHDQTSRNDDSGIVVPGCCISAAFGHSDGSEQIASVPLKDFTFDLFFDLFLQIWPREEIADMFASYSDGFGHMDHNGLNQFLNRSISKAMQIRSNRELYASTTRLDCPRKIKHINLMQWEAKHFYRSTSNVDKRLDPGSGSTVHRSRSEHRTNNHSRGTTRGEKHGIGHNQTSRDQSIGTQIIHTPFQLSTDEFRKLVQCYERNDLAKAHNRFSVQGFYRFMLSYHYNLLMRYHTINDQCPTVDADRTGVRMMEPLTHYHIQSARLVSPRFRGENPSQPIGDQADLIRRRNTLILTRSVRQLLLLGTRALVLDCWSTNPNLHQDSGKDIEWFVQPTDLLGEPEILTDSAITDRASSYSKEVRLVQRQLHSVPLINVLKAIRNAVFTVSHYPFMLFLRLESMGSQEQNLLASLLQEFLSDWLLIPPLPKFVAQANSPYAEKSKYYSQAHQLMPSPEALRNKILVNISQLQREVPTNLSTNPIANKQCVDDGNPNVPRVGKLAPLTVLVTDPEGEEQIAKPDIGSVGSSTQLSPSANRRLININGNPTRFFHPRTHQFAYSTHKPALLKHRNGYMGTLMSPHPRLARLIALSEPEPLPPLCQLLFMQHHRSTVARTRLPHANETVERTLYANSFDAVAQTRTELGNTGNNRKSVDSKDNIELVDEFEVILSLSSLTFARTVQLQHRARKQRLLKRLLHEAYGNRTHPRVQKKSTDGECQKPNAGMNKMNKKGEGRPAGMLLTQTTAASESLRPKGFRSWFGKRVPPPTNPTEPLNNSNQPSLLSTEASTTTRRPSLIALPFRNRSPVTEKTSSTTKECKSGPMRNRFTSFYRRFSIRSTDTTSPKTPPPKVSESQEPTTGHGGKPVFDFRLSQSSNPTRSQVSRSASTTSMVTTASYSTSHTTSSSTSSSTRSSSAHSTSERVLTTGGKNKLYGRSKTTTNLTTDSRHRSQTEDKYSRSRVSKKSSMNFGRCSCSSGSKSRDSSSESRDPDGVNAGLETKSSWKTKLRKEQSIPSSGLKTKQSASSSSSGGGAAVAAAGADLIPNKEMVKTKKHKSSKRSPTRKNPTGRIGSIKHSANSTLPTSCSVKSKLSPDNTGSSTSGSSETTETSFTSTGSSMLEQLIMNRFTSGHLRTRVNRSESDQSTDSTESDLDRQPARGALQRQATVNGPIKMGASDMKDHRTVLRSETLALDASKARKTGREGVNGERKQSEEKFPTTIPRRALWRQANQWLTKCRVVITTVVQVLRILENRSSAKALAEYGKHRLILLHPVQHSCNWSTRQILRLSGCQLIPIDIAMLIGPMDCLSPPITEQATVFQSTRQQLTGTYEVEQAMIQANGPYTGYMLKPSQLRCPTSVHIHRYPKEWIFKGIPTADLTSAASSSDSDGTHWFPPSDRSRWPVLPCTCCYDPFTMRIGHEHLKRLQQERYVGALRAYQQTERESFLPWNFSVHIITLSEMFKHHERASCAESSDTPGTGPKPGHKLPRRYQRAASSAAAAAAAAATTSTATVGLMRGPSERSPLQPSRTAHATLFGLSNSHSTENVIQADTLHYSTSDHLHPKSDVQMESNFGAKLSSSMKETKKKSFFMQARLLHPVTLTSVDVVTNAMSSISSIVEHVQPFESTTSPFPQPRTNHLSHAQTTPNIQTLTSLFREVTVDPSRTDPTTPPYRSCSLLHLSQPDLAYDPLRGFRVEFVRIPLPDSIVLRLEAIRMSDRGRTPRLIASQLISTACPLRNTLTGYSHLQLHMHEACPTSTGPDLNRSIHQTIHETLKNSIGLLLFCKLHMEVYTPACFGELVDSVQLEYSSRSNSLNRHLLRPSTNRRCTTPSHLLAVASSNLKRNTCNSNQAWFTDSTSDEPSNDIR